MFSISAGVMKLQTKRYSNIFLLAVVSTKKKIRSRIAKIGKSTSKLGTIQFTLIEMNSLNVLTNLVSVFHEISVIIPNNVPNNVHLGFYFGKEGSEHLCLGHFWI